MPSTNLANDRLTLGELILQRSAELTPSERKVARTLFATNLMAGFDTVAELAERTQVSGPTVIRFVTKLGFSGYPEFQRALRRDLAARIDSPLAMYRRREGESGPGDLVERARETFARGIDATFLSLARADLDAVVALLADKRRPVWTTGGRFSHASAELLHAHLYQLRPHCHVIGFDGGGRDDALLDLGRRDVLVVFDVRRYQKDTVLFAQKAAERGVTIVLVTDPWLSPIADVARHVLTVSVEAPSPYDSMVPTVALVETLVAALIARMGPSTQRRIEELERLRIGFTWGESYRSGGGASGS
ncbi:MAG: MurR/RpiR family transcriptional regulator [Kiloniellales bacterium]